MKSKPEQDEDLELPEWDFSKTGVLVEDYKDLEVEMIEGSRAKTLWWMKHYD